MRARLPMVFGPLSAAEAARRIDDWYQRGFVLCTDLATRSCRLVRVRAESSEP